MVFYPAPRTFTEFYDLMRMSRTVRMRIVGEALRGRIARRESERLRDIRDALLAMPRDGEDREHFRLLTHEEGPELPLRIDYELNELRRDIYLLERGSDALEDLIAAGENDPAGGTAAPAERFRSEVAEAAQFIADASPTALITDRDGTINNYCDRYRSSVQPAYNAIYLTRFRRTLPGPLAILTAAPLTDGGLLQLSTMPIRTALYAGSKGREFLDRKGRVQRAQLDAEASEALERVNRKLEHLLAEPRFVLFRYVGSGLQLKVGETVLARQTASNGVPSELSAEIASRVESIVKDIDRNGELLTLYDTGKDLEVTARAGESDGTAPESTSGGRSKGAEHGAGERAGLGAGGTGLAGGGADKRTAAGSGTFDKGRGIRFLDDAVPLELASQDVLVCGDTSSDLPMFEAVRDMSRSARAILVTEDDELRMDAGSLGIPLCSVSSPDTLVLSLRAAATRSAATG